jgi:hypothetical protein
MRIIISDSSTNNLCVDCPNCFTECDPTFLEFGNGPGNDNVVKCSEYTGKMIAGLSYGGIAPKREAK